MKRVMIVGASVGQLSLIKKAKELGYYVGIADFNENAVGVPFADKFYNTSTIDENGMLAAAIDFQVDGITTVQTDMPMRSIGKVNQELGLPGIDYVTALKSTDKVKMIECFKENNVSAPWFFAIEKTGELEKIKDEISFPCIFKPADNSASRGVVCVKSNDEVDNAWNYSKKYSKNGKILIEEYMQGPEFSVEIIVKNGEAYVIAVTDKLTTGAPFFVEMGHSQPSFLEEDKLEKVETLAKKAILAVGVKNGEGHVEIIYTEEGPKVVELGARLGGDFITSDLVPLSTGVDMLATTIQIACGDEIDIERKFEKGSAIRFFDAPEGTIKSIDGVDKAFEIPGVRRIELFRKEGDTIQKIKNSLDRVGCVIAQADTAEQAIDICKNAMELIKIEVE